VRNSSAKYGDKSKQTTHRGNVQVNDKIAFGDYPELQVQIVADKPQGVRAGFG